MATSKSFRIKRDEKPVIEFDFTLEDQVVTPAVGTPGEEGYTPEVRGDVVEKFSARPSVPGELLLDVVASGAAGAEYQASALQRFLARCLVADDRERFATLIESSDPPVPLETLSEMAAWLTEQYTARPTNKSAE